MVRVYVKRKAIEQNSFEESMIQFHLSNSDYGTFAHMKNILENKVNMIFRVFMEAAIFTFRILT